MASKEQAWSVLTEVVTVLEAGTKVSDPDLFPVLPPSLPREPAFAFTQFPEMELVWLMVRTWNTGVHLYR